MLPTVLTSVWLSAGLLVVPALVTLAAVRPHAHLADTESQTRRLRVAVAATTVALLSLGASALIGSGPLPATLAAVILGAAVLFEARRSVTWAVRGAVAWALLVVGAGSFLGWLLHRLLVSSLPPWQAVVSAAAWVLLALATLRLRAPVESAVAARARARSTATATATPPQLRRQLWPLASLVTAGAVAVVGTSVGLESGDTRPSGPRVRSGEDLTSASHTAPSGRTRVSTSSTTVPTDRATPPPVQATAPDATLAPRPRRARETERAREVTEAQGSAEEPRRTTRDAPVLRPRNTPPVATAAAVAASSPTGGPGPRSGPAGPDDAADAAAAAGPDAAQAPDRARVRSGSESLRRARAPHRERGPSACPSARASSKAAGRETARPTAWRVAPTPAGPGSESTPSPDRQRPVQPQETVTADTRKQRTGSARPVERPTKVWGVMPPDAVPHGRGWED